MWLINRNPRSVVEEEEEEEEKRRVEVGSVGFICVLPGHQRC